jgi:malate dehydrogenase
MAFAGFRFAEKVIAAASGKTGIIEPTYVYLPGVPGGDEIAKATGVDYFSVPVELGPNGVKKVFNVVKDADEYEQGLLKKAYEGLKGNIDKGVEFASKSK